MFFTWELVRSNGDVINITGYMEPTVKLRHNDADYASSLNYTLSTDDSLGMIRCIVQVDDGTNGRYEAKDERHIPCCGNCYNKAHQNIYEIYIYYRYIT